MTNGKRAEEIIKKYGFDFSSIPKKEIIDLIQKEIADYYSGSSEYIRLLCGYLYCLGDSSDVPLLEKAKYGIDFDVQCMIDGQWIDSLKNGGIEAQDVDSREALIEGFVSYYENFRSEDEDEW